MAVLLHNKPFLKHFHILEILHVVSDMLKTAFTTDSFKF